METTDKNSRPKGPDRITLGSTEGAKVEAWLKQIHEKSKFLTLSKSDLVNFFIREHRAELSAKEIVQIRADNYDAIRHINWITVELKAALSSGDMAAVAMLQEEIKGIELSITQMPPEGMRGAEDGRQDSEKIRKLRKKKQSEVSLESAAQPVRPTDITG